MPAGRAGRTDITAGWKLKNQNGRLTLSGKEGEREEIVFSASLIV
jgi:hypothetical protein